MATMHHIKRLEVDLRVPDQEQARDLQQEVSIFCRTQLHEVLEEVFDLAAPDCYLRIDRLELTLPAFRDVADFRNKVTERLRQELGFQLAEAKDVTAAAARAGAGTGDKAGPDTASFSPLYQAADIFFYILKYGIAPWHAISVKYDDLVKEVIELLQVEHSFRLHLAGVFASSDQVLRRFILQTPSPTRHRILELITGYDGSLVVDIERFMEIVARTLTRRSGLDDNNQLLAREITCRNILHTGAIDNDVFGLVLKELLTKLLASSGIKVHRMLPALPLADIEIESVLPKHWRKRWKEGWRDRYLSTLASFLPPEESKAAVDSPADGSTSPENRMSDSVERQEHVQDDKLKTEISMQSGRLETETSVQSSKSKRDPSVQSSKPERDPSIQSSKPERDPSIQSSKPERDPSVQSSKPERDPSVQSSEPERDPSVQSSKPERDPSVQSSKSERDTSLQSTKPEADTSVQSTKPETETSVEGDNTRTEMSKEAKPTTEKILQREVEKLPPEAQEVAYRGGERGQPEKNTPVKDNEGQEIEGLHVTGKVSDSTGERHDIKDTGQNLTTIIPRTDQAAGLPWMSRYEVEELHINNAGLVLLAPFFGLVFKDLGYLDQKRNFASEELQTRAVHFSQFLVVAKQHPPEANLALNKVLCGMEVAVSMERFIDLSAKELGAAQEVINSALMHWSALKRTSAPVFRQTFLKHEGILTSQGGNWLLRIERTSVDILLDTLPWTISIIKHPWMKQPVMVEW